MPTPELTSLYHIKLQYSPPNIKAKSACRKLIENGVIFIGRAGCKLASSAFPEAEENTDRLLSISAAAAGARL